MHYLISLKMLKFSPMLGIVSVCFKYLHVLVCFSRYLFVVFEVFTSKGLLTLGSLFLFKTKALKSSLETEHGGRLVS